jgi:hypothetical protein
MLIEEWNIFTSYRDEQVVRQNWNFDEYEKKWQQNGLEVD